MKRILIVEDHIITMLGIRQVLLEYYKEAEIHTTDNYEDTLELLSGQDVDLIILDVDITGGSKLNMIEGIRLKQPDVRILMFSGQDEQIYALPFLRAGADGYLSKKASTKEFIDAVEIIFQNRKYLSSAMLQENIRHMTQPESNDSQSLRLLTQRELEVAQLLATGDSTSEISKKLFLSASAISIYKSRVFQKLGLKNIIELSSFLALNQ